MTPRKLRVLVTDGETRAALAVTRSLGRAGHEVIVGEKHAPSLARTSRYCAAGILYPDPISASEDFVDFLAATAKSRAIDVLIPIADITTFLVTSHREMFDASCAIPFAAADVIARAANKVDVVQTATRLGVPVPRSVVVADPDEVPSAGLEFPLVIKPWQSRVRTARGWASTAVSYASDRDALMRDLRGRASHEFPVMLQERIVGPGVGVFALYHEGRAVALFGHRRLKERPPWGGVSVLSESVALCPHARDAATRLLDELGWHGVAMVEFKHDLRDDIPKLMEINGRFWGSLQLAVDAGVDFPALLVGSGCHERLETQPPYRVGVRNRWFWGGVDSLLLTLLRKNGGPSTAGAGRVRATLEFMKFWGRELHYDNPKWDDPRPWLFETKAWFARAAQDGAPGERTSAPKNGASRSHDVVQIVRARIVSTLDQVGLTESEWNALAARSSTNSVFQTHQWIQSWWTTFGDQHEPLFVKVSDASGVSGVAPLFVEQGALRDRVIRFVGDGRADYCDLLADAAKPHVVSSMFDAIRAYRRWDVIELNNVPAASQTVRIVRALCERAGYRLLMNDQYLCQALLIQGQEDYAHHLLNKSSLRRPHNYFRRAGRLVYRDLTTLEEVGPYLETFFNQHIARWSESRSPSLFVNPRNRRFYRELAASLDRTAWLLFSVVELDDRPIAFHYGFDYDGSVTWYKPSFDVAYASHSPGLALMRHLIDYAVTLNRRELDFTVGDEPFKQRFTNRTRKTIRIRIFQDPARFLLESSGRSLMRTMKRFSRT